MKIGNIEFREKPIFLAPMEDVTDAAFRYICKQYGVDLMYSEFVSSDALVRMVNKSLQKMTLHDYERPFAIQLYGKNVQSMAGSVRIAESFEPDIIDLNFGCPVKKVAYKGAGAGLLRDVPKMIKIARAVVRATNIPVTAKTRLGWDDDSKNIVEVAERLQDTGIQALCIHGRTRAQMYKGEANWELIGAVKNNPRMHIPIIGNGDINSADKAKEMFNNYGVDAIMVGRASIGRPWIFKEIRHFLDTGEYLSPFTVKDQVATLRAQMEKGREWKEERRSILGMRRFFATSFKGLKSFKETRIKLLQADSPEEVEAILDHIVDHWGENPV